MLRTKMNAIVKIRNSHGRNFSIPKILNENDTLPKNDNSENEKEGTPTLENASEGNTTPVTLNTPLSPPTPPPFGKASPEFKADLPNDPSVTSPLPPIESSPCAKSLANENETLPPITVQPSKISLKEGNLNVMNADGEIEEIQIKVKFSDINPLTSAGSVIKKPNTFLVTTFTGLLFGVQYSIAYTAALSFAAPPYNYGAFDIGLVLLAFGIGNLIGSIFGGRYSDYIFLKLKERNGGIGQPEMRLKSSLSALWILPPSIVAYAWVVEKGCHIYWCVIVLVICGLSSLCGFKPFYLHSFPCS